MSTPTDLTVPTVPTVPTVVKPKRVMSEAQLLSLSAARQKAMEKRTMIKDINDREKSVKQQELQKRIETLATNEKGLSVKQTKAKAKKVPVNYSSSESDTSSESFAEEVQPKQMKKTAKKAPVSRVNTTKLTNEVARGELQRRIHEENYKVAFQSLFPGHKHFA